MKNFNLQRLWQNNRSAPVLGRSNVEKQWQLEDFKCFRRFGRGCARDRRTPDGGLKTGFQAKFLGWSLCLSVACLIARPAPAADPPAKPTRPPIYDTKADGATQIADALARAKREHKQVLLQFGANWCGWCHKLHTLFQSDKNIAAFLKSNYVLVLVDVDKMDGKMHNASTNEKYGNPCRLGLPSLVVLDADGKQVTTQDSGKLEKGDRHDPALVLKFLKEWAPRTPPKN